MMDTEPMLDQTLDTLIQSLSEMRQMKFLVLISKVIGKNIFNIDEYWISTEQTKRFFIYVYEIEDEDLEKFFVAL